MLFNSDRRTNRDRRATPRTPASGRVTISFENPTRVTIDGELVETSETGFRLSHDSPALEPGLEISYAGANRQGRARVMWTHVQEGRRVSGFAIHF